MVWFKTFERILSLWVFIVLVVFALFLVLLFYLGSFVLSNKDFYVFKLGCFESGFVSVGKVQNSFRIHFFVIILIFVIFDLEIVIFLGILVSDVFSLLSFFLLIFFILGGFYIEWWYGKLIWVVY